MSANGPRTEHLIQTEDERTGLRAFIAIDDTTLGPALGGVRFAVYASAEAASLEARRLAAAMTLKNAAAELPYGGGKSVIVAGGPVPDRAALMHAFGRAVAATHGRYLPGVDMGTTVEDLAEVGRAGADVACDEEDPSPWTALGVWSGIRAAIAHTDDASDLDGRTVAIQGVGNVGADLARRVAAEGARVVLADTATDRVEALAAELDARVVATEEIATVDCDVFAPCATARVVTEENVDRLGARIVAGAANDLLATPELAARMAARGITYVPDFLVNAGGVVHIHALRAGWDEARLTSAVLSIGDRVARALRNARIAGRTPAAEATDVARARIATHRHRPPVDLAA